MNSSVCTAFTAVLLCIIFLQMSVAQRTQHNKNESSSRKPIEEEIQNTDSLPSYEAPPNRMPNAQKPPHRSKEIYRSMPSNKIINNGSNIKNNNINNEETQILTYSTTRRRFRRRDIEEKLNGHILNAKIQAGQLILKNKANCFGNKRPRTTTTTTTTTEATEEETSTSSESTESESLRARNLSRKSKSKASNKKKVSNKKTSTKNATKNKN